MKTTDWKLTIAVLILIVLVIALLFISLDRSNKVERLSKAIESIKSQSISIPKVTDGHTPVLGVDYFNGKNATDDQVQKAVSSYMLTHPVKSGIDGLSGTDGASAYDIAVLNGFTGNSQQWLDSLKVKGDKGDPAAELQIDCQDNHIATKYSTDTLWQPTKIKCEVDSE